LKWQNDYFRFYHGHSQSFNLVLHKHGDLLYNGVRETVTEHLNVIGQQVAHVSDELLLTELADKWYYHKMTMSMIKDILMYMVSSVSVCVVL
jgi:cullin 3